MTITVRLADDHVLFRQGWALLVREHGDGEIVGEAGDGAEAVALAETHQPQIAVLDVEMPGMNGIEATRRIRQVAPATRIVALSMYGDAYYEQRMFAAGASVVAGAAGAAGAACASAAPESAQPSRAASAVDRRAWAAGERA